MKQTFNAEYYFLAPSIEELVNETVEEGTDVTFKVDIRCVQNPEATWLKKDVEIQPSDKAEMKIDSGYAELTLKECNKSDTGKVSVKITGRNFARQQKDGTLTVRGV